MAKFNTERCLGNTFYSFGFGFIAIAIADIIIYSYDEIDVDRDLAVKRVPYFGSFHKSEKQEKRRRRRKSAEENSMETTFDIGYQLENFFNFL